MNPWREGDYLCYGEAVEISEGHFAAYYFVEHHPPNGEIRCVLERNRLGQETYATTHLAIINAITKGQMWARSQS